MSPPPSADDWMGPAIGASLAVVLAPATIYGGVEVAFAAMPNPAAVTSAAQAVVERYGGAGSVGGAIGLAATTVESRAAQLATRA